MSNIFGSPRRFRDDDWWQKRDSDRLIDDLKARTERLLDDEPGVKHSSFSTSSSKRESTTRTSEFSSGRKLSDPEKKEETEAKEFFEEENQFVVKVDVSKFPIEKVHVKVLADNTLLIDAEHEEKSGDHNVVTRTLCRKFVLPTAVDTEEVASQVDGGGMLTICAPKRGAGNKGERVIPVKLV